MMFLCPAYLDEEGALRCGLPAEVTARFAMSSSDGPIECAVIRCPSGHWFNAPIEFLTAEKQEEHAPGRAGRALDNARQPPPPSDYRQRPLITSQFAAAAALLPSCYRRAFRRA